MENIERSILLGKYEKIKGFSSNLFDNEEWAEFDAFHIGYTLAKSEQNNCISDTMLSFPDIRNKLSPFKNLMAMIDNGLVKGTIEVHQLIQNEILECKRSLDYLSGNEAVRENGDVFEKKAVNAKKSNFQTRLDDAAKKREQRTNELK